MGTRSRCRRSLLLACGLVVGASTACAQLDYVLRSSDAIGSSSWKSPGNWGDTNGTASPDAPVAGKNYSTGAFELRTPDSTSAGAFAGDSLTVPVGGGLRFKGANGDVATIDELVMDGGRVVNGNNNALYSLQGNVLVQSASSFEGGGSNRVLSIPAELRGAGSLTVAGLGTVVLGGSNTVFSGGIVVSNATLVTVSSNALGTGKLDITGSAVFQSPASLDAVRTKLSVNGRFHLDADHRFFRVSVGTEVLTPGVHTFADLAARFPTNFPPTWSPLPGATSSTNGAGSITVTGAGIGASHTLESARLRLTVYEHPFTFEVQEKATGQILLVQSATRFTIGGVSREAERASLVAMDGVTAVFDLQLAGSSAVCRVSFRFTEDGVLRATLSGQGSATQVAQEFHDLGEEIFGGFECPPSATQASLSSRNTSQKLAQNLGLPGIVSTASAKAPFYFSDRRYGVYADTDALGVLTMGKNGRSGFSFDVPELTFYVMHGDYKDILFSYNRIAGGSFMPPLWAFDSIWWKDDDSDSRYFPPGVTNAQGSVLNTADKLAEHQIRAGAILVDRPYGTSNPAFAGDGGWGNFDFDPAGFPDPTGMVASLQAKGLNLMLWITDHCWSDLHDEGVANGWLFDAAKTNAYTTADFSNPDAYDWFRGKLDTFVSLGIKGYKIDRLDERASPDAVNNRNNTLFQKLAWEGLEKVQPGGAFSFSRCASDRARQYTAIWNGDSYATFEGLRFSVLCGLRSGMINFPMWGSDTGSYRDPPTEELFARWFQFSAYSTMMQVLIGSGTQAYKPRSPWYDYSPNLVAIARDQANAHHDLMPYSRSQMRQATLTGMPVMRPIMMEFPNDPNLSVTITNCTYMFGDALLVAPVVAAGATTRDVYLPAGKWLDYHDRSTVHAGSSSIVADAPLERIPLFVREGSIIPRGDIYRGNNVWTAGWKPSLRVEMFPSSYTPSAFTYYTGLADREITCDPVGATLSVQLGDLAVPGHLEIYCVNPGRVTRNGVVLVPFVDYEYQISNRLLRVPFSGATSLNVANFRSLFDTAARPHEFWREENFGNSGDPRVSAPDADPDGDGLFNLEEYASGTDPLSSEQHDLYAVVSGPDGQPECRLWIDAERTDIVYTLQSSSDLQVWSDVATSIGGGEMIVAGGSGAVIADPGTGRRQVSVRLAAALPQAFFRVRISLQGNQGS